jgi:methylenetetrahydrofolate reductase (NADPH)
MPIYNTKMMEHLAALCGATITEEVRTGIAALPPDDKSALNDFGVAFAARQCRELIENGVPGIHIYTMDRAKSATAIVNALRADGIL